VINSGAKSEKYLRTYYADLPDAAFVHYGNAIGETLRIASELGITQVTLGIMIGKAVKLAEGHLDTHSKKITMNKAFLASIARDAGCSDETVEAIDRITLARELRTVIPAKEQAAFFFRLIRLCHAHCAPLLPQGTLSMVLMNEDGEFLDSSYIKNTITF
jgi:cobalt-precorrin-5B (C1)-methyltransferase